MTSSVADWITAFSTGLMAVTGLTALGEYFSRRKEKRLAQLDSKVIWWFFTVPENKGITADNLAAELGNTLPEITDSLFRLGTQGIVHNGQGGKAWFLNRSTMFRDKRWR